MPRLAAAACLALCACGGNPQQLPVAISRCNAVQTPLGFDITATVENKSTKPISALSISTDFYHDFRYSKFTAATHLGKELDPGQKRDVNFTLAAQNGARPSGQAMRCLATHIDYLDGTSQSAH